MLDTDSNRSILFSTSLFTNPYTMKVTYKVERIFPLEQYGNVKPSITMEKELDNEDDEAKFLAEAEDVCIKSFISFKSKLK